MAFWVFTSWFSITLIDYLLIFIGGILILSGLLGCFLPVIPGPPLSFIGLLIIQLTNFSHFSISFLIWCLLLSLLALGLDYLIPIIGAKKFGSSKYGIWGSVIGLVIGLFLPPFGIIWGPVAGAIAGELILGRNYNDALKSGVGTFAGFILGTFFKVGVCGYYIYHFFAQISS